MGLVPRGVRTANWHAFIEAGNTTGTDTGGDGCGRGANQQIVDLHEHSRPFRNRAVPAPLHVVVFTVPRLAATHSAKAASLAGFNRLGQTSYHRARCAAPL